MNALAEELNEALAGSVASRLLSDLGKRMYFPKGIISQSAEADERAKRFNATQGGFKIQWIHAHHGRGDPDGGRPGRARN